MLIPEKDWVTFSMEIKNDSDYYVEYMDYPEMTVANQFVSDGGTGKLFWPAMEGCEIEDPAQRESSELALPYRYKPVSYPSKGWEGFYPGPVQMQFMAYYSEDAGFYFAAHDPYHHPKAIEYHKTGDGVRMEYRTFVAVDKHAEWTDRFPFVLKDGILSWIDAAEIYREFAENNYTNLPEKRTEKTDVPEWLNKAPFVLLYPVRGEKDTGSMEPNCYFPYENIIPIVEKYAAELNTRIMVIVMHWEGTAPWSPPYIWPPYGGEEMLSRFVKKMHEGGHLVGLYASGIGWTDESILLPEYNMKQYREEHGLIDIMCAAPDQSVWNSLICNGTIRWGYDMCPANDFVKECVLGEIAKVMTSDIDYLQFFDQNLGGMSELCYSNKHGHLPVHGKWAVEAMKGLYDAIEEMIKEKQSSLVIGCEAAAAESYSHTLLFNDLRYNINYSYGKPVPAYAFVYHQYLFNFMGNSNSFNTVMPYTKNPFSLHFRMAYSFVAGDTLSGVLNGKGEIFWDWGTAWETESPEQSSLIQLVRNLMCVRNGVAQKYFFSGKMIRPIAYETGGNFQLIRSDDTAITYPDVLSSAWEDEEQNQVQVFVNYTDSDKKVLLSKPCAVITESEFSDPVREFVVGKYQAVLVKINDLKH